MTPPPLTLTPDVLAALREHARREHPLECCGLLAGRGTRATRAYAVANELASPVAFRTEARDSLAAFRAMRAAGVELLAVYHSHPTSPAVPSATDLAENPYGEAVVCVILGADGVRAWRLSAESFTEVPLETVPAEIATES